VSTAGPKGTRLPGSLSTAGPKGTRLPSSLSTTDPKINSAKGQVYDHEGLIALARYQPFTTRKPFTKNAPTPRTGE
jgi:hypothetical protein